MQKDGAQLQLYWEDTKILFELLSGHSVHVQRLGQIHSRDPSDGERQNETRHFQNARCSSASDAVWMAMALDIVD